MQVRAVWAAIAALTFIGIATKGHAQTAEPISIPLEYWEGAQKLAINVGINGGAPKPYVFDTGSPVFNAVYNESWWPNTTPDPNHNNVPSSSLPTNAQFCLGGSTTTFCRGYTGNLIQVPTLSFYKSTSDAAPTATLNASPGYVVNAAYNYAGTPMPFDSPPLDGHFYGTFGAGNFATNVEVVPNADGRGGTPTGYYAGGILGQTILPGLTQGYVVAANGQKNPVSSVNGPQQVNGIKVTIGGQTMQPVTACSPCVTVGLTREMLGQFWAAPPTVGGSAGVIPWAETADGTFPNPYGGTVGNNSSKEMGTYYKVTLTAPGATTPAISETVLGLLDSGTPDLNLSTSASAEKIAEVATNGRVHAGVTFTVTGVAPGEKPVPGLTTTSAVVTHQGSPDPITYNGLLSPPDEGKKPTNTIGISFFLQNSVMYDLTDKVIGYTPFFVTNAPLATTAGGPLIVDGTNVPLGLAGVVSGAGGVTLHGGGAVQLSAVNTYAGSTIIDGGAELYISGIGSIAASSGVANNGVFDISRAWSAVSIQDLSGSGDVRLGGQNLIVTNAAGTFTGRMSDVGSYPGIGGSLTLAGGNLILSGTSSYTGLTTLLAGKLQAGAANAFSPGSTHVIASGATLDLDNFNQTIGALGGGGNVTLGSATLTAGGNNASMPFHGTISGAGGFTKEGAGAQFFTGANTYEGPTTVNSGMLFVDGALTHSNTSVNAGGVFGGTGNVRSVSVNGGAFAPGNAGTRMTVNGDLGFTGASTYLVFADSASVSSALVNGTASLGGATVNAQFLAGIHPARQYTILTATGGLTGSFGAVTTNLPTGFQTAVVNRGNDAILKLTAALAADGEASLNQQSIATTINSYFNSGGTLPQGFLTVFGLTGASLQNALNQLSGEAGASISSSTFVAWQQFFNLVFDPFAENRGGFGGGALPYASQAQQSPDGARSAYAAVTPKGMVVKAVPYQQVEPLWRVWGGGYGGTARTDGNTALGSHETTNRAYGFAVGVDRKLTPDTLIGFALAGGGTSFGLSQALGGGTSDMFQASAYARQAWGAAYLMGALGYGWQDFTLKRTVTLAGADNLQADFNANTFAGRAETGWRFGSPFAGMTPYAAVQVVSIDLPAYSERATSGASTFALSYNGRADTQTRSELGARFDYAMPMQESVLTLRGRAAWAHDYSDDRIANAGFLALPGTAFGVYGASPDANALLVSAGAELALRNGFVLAGSFEGEFSSNTESYAGKGSVRYRW